ncbi:hypothetical protein OHT61_09245 [Streptomyces sp. NBC_00178]|nr:hypothetical protein [Streptomyces sp. NBC_00178]
MSGPQPVVRTLQLCRRSGITRPFELIPPRNFLRDKKQEWEEYRSEVTAFELKNLLPVL